MVFCLPDSTWKQISTRRVSRRFALRSLARSSLIGLVELDRRPKPHKSRSILVGYNEEVSDGFLSELVCFGLCSRNAAKVSDIIRISVMIMLAIKAIVVLFSRLYVRARGWCLSVLPEAEFAITVAMLVLLYAVYKCM